MGGIMFALSREDAIDRGRFESARDSLVHRGPDAAGAAYLDHNRVALGHPRLSIIDLCASANQPMQLDMLWITFNEW